MQHKDYPLSTTTQKRQIIFYPFVARSASMLEDASRLSCIKVRLRLTPSTELFTQGVTKFFLGLAVQFLLPVELTHEIRGEFGRLGCLFLQFSLAAQTFFIRSFLYCPKIQKEVS